MTVHAGSHSITARDDFDRIKCKCCTGKTFPTRASVYMCLFVSELMDHQREGEGDRAHVTDSFHQASSISTPGPLACHSISHSMD